MQNHVDSCRLMQAHGDSWKLMEAHVEDNGMLCDGKHPNGIQCIQSNGLAGSISRSSTSPVISSLVLILVRIFGLRNSKPLWASRKLSEKIFQLKNIFGQ